MMKLKIKRYPTGLIQKQTPDSVSRLSLLRYVGVEFHYNFKIASRLPNLSNKQLEIIYDLNSNLDIADYFISGSIALNLYGIINRKPDDIDVEFTSSEERNKFKKYLISIGFEQEVSENNYKYTASNSHVRMKRKDLCVCLFNKVQGSNSYYFAHTDNLYFFLSNPYHILNAKQSYLHKLKPSDKSYQKHYNDIKAYNEHPVAHKTGRYYAI